MPKWICVHPWVCTPVFAQLGLVFICVRVCEEQSSDVVSASISSDIIYGNKCIRCLLNMPLSFSKKEHRIQTVLPQLSHEAKRQRDELDPGPHYRKDKRVLFNLISWLSKVMFHYKWQSWLCWAASKADDKNWNCVRESKRPHYLRWGKKRFVLCFKPEDFPDTSESLLFSSWGSSKWLSIHFKFYCKLFSPLHW